MYSGIPLGYIETKFSKLDGILGLLSSKLDDARAVRRFLTSLKKTQPPSMVWIDPNHAAIFAPTGAGKNVSIAGPLLLTSSDSMVVLDIKGENYLLSAKARRKMGQRIVCLDPFNHVGGPDTFNPLQFIDPADPNAFDKCKSIANAIVIRTGKETDPFWNDSAQAVIGLFIGFVVCFAELPDKNLQMVRMLLSSSKRFREAIEHCCTATEWGGMLARAAHQAAQLQDKVLASVLATVHQHMGFLDTTAVAANTTTSSFNPADLVNGKMTVYLVIPPEHMKTNSALLRMWLGSFLGAVMQCGLQESRKTRFLIDEAAQVGKMDVLETALNVGRGYGIRLLFMYQGIGQLQEAWGSEGAAQTLLSNTTQVFFGVNEPKTAEYVSSRLGDFTNIVLGGGTTEGTSYSGGEKSGGRSYSTGSSESWQQAARRLLQPSEVMQLDLRQAITFHPDLPPLMTYLPRVYERDWNAQNDIGLFRAAVDALCVLGAAAIPAIVASMLVFREFK
jgi:type IV secretion system protein VirD4